MIDRNMSRLLALVEERADHPDVPSDIRPSSDNLGDVARANATVAIAGPNGWANTADLVGGVSSDYREQARVDAIYAAMISPEGYFERIIIDGEGQVIEGQHRLEASRKAGWDRIPVTQIVLIDSLVPLSEIREKVRDATQLHREQITQLITNVYGDLLLDDEMGTPYTSDDIAEPWLSKYEAARKILARYPIEIFKVTDA